jgi:hypothetical protein
MNDDALCGVGNCENLEMLDVGGGSITDKAAPFFARCKRLQEVDVEGTAIGSEVIEALAGCPLLAVVRARRTQISDKDVTRLTACPMLSSLDASWCALKGSSIEALARHPRLSVLDVGEHAGIGDDALKPLEHSAALTRLGISNTGASRDSLVRLSRIGSLRYFAGVGCGWDKATVCEIMTRRPELEVVSGRSGQGW